MCRWSGPGHGTATAAADLRRLRDDRVWPAGSYPLIGRSRRNSPSEVQFWGWTDDRQLRHASFKGVRGGAELDDIPDIASSGRTCSLQTDRAARRVNARAARLHRGGDQTVVPIPETARISVVTNVWAICVLVICTSYLLALRWAETRSLKRLFLRR